MTTTGTYTGMDSIAKPTSKVLAPPGGTTSLSLGGYGDDNGTATNKQTSEAVETEDNQPTQTQQDLYKPSPPQPIRPTVGNNPVTGEPYRAGPPESASDPEPSPGGRRAKPVKLDPASMPAAGGRVENKAPMKRQPPGGKDSGIFG